MLHRTSAWALCSMLVLHAALAPAAIQTPPLQTLVPEIRSDEGTSQVADTLREASKHFQAGELDKCFELLESARKTQANLPPPRLMLARLFLAASRVPQGRADLERAAAEAPDYPGIYLTFGRLALAEGRLTDANLHFQQASALPVPANWTDEQKRFLQVEANAGRAAVAERREDWKSARAALAAWLEVEPNNGQARHRLGRTLFQLGSPEEAYSELQRAVQEDDTLEPAAVSMAWLYERKADHSSAAKWMEDAVRQAPDDSRVHQAYAAWLTGQDRMKEAKSEADVAARLAPDSRQLTMLRGQIARALGDYEEAETLFSAVFQESPGDAEATNQLAVVLAEQSVQSKRDRALQLAEVNARQYSRDPEALATLGWVNYRMGKQQEAERLLRAAMSSGQVRADTAYYFARVLTERGNPDESAQARKVLRSAIEKPGIFVLRGEAERWLAKQEDNDRP